MALVHVDELVEQMDAAGAEVFVMAQQALEIGFGITALGLWCDRQSIRSCGWVGGAVDAAVGAAAAGEDGEAMVSDWKCPMGAAEA